MSAPSPSSPSSKRPTLRDVATLAGVSFKSVSRVVNGEPDVSDAMRAKVTAAVEELGYQLDTRAATLRSSSSATAAIGFVQVDVRNPFFASVLRGLEDRFGAAGYVVLSGSTDGEAARQDELLRTFVARRVDGLVVVAHGDEHGLLDAEVRRGTPVVCVDIEPDGIAVDMVGSDNRGGVETAVRHLIAHGHRRIAYLGDGARNTTSGGRRDGYVAALESAGIAVDERLVVQDVDGPERAADATRELLLGADPPTAVMSSQNLISYGALKAIHHLGMQRRVAFVGFDDIAFSDVITPAITVVPQDPLHIGHRAADLLLARLDDPSRPVTRETLPVPLVPRGSGEIPGPELSAASQGQE